MTKIIAYEDTRRGVRGWLAYDGTERPLAAGGCRLLPGLRAEDLAELAGRMTLKQRVLGINVDGAKCGLDLDPRSPHKAEALRGFLAFLRGELTERFSMGSDMGTGWNELQRIAATVGLPSIKYSVRRAQGLTDEAFRARMERLDDRVGLLTLSERRAGHALAHAVLGAARAAGVTGEVTYALQGFGNLGRAAACTLDEEGARLVAVADEHGTVADPAGLNVPRMLATPDRTPVPELDTPGTRGPASAVFRAEADVFAPAACADAMNDKAVAAARFAAVAVGANCGLSDAAERGLHTRGVFVVPDFIGGIGGSASMEALFGPREVPSARAVLDSLAGIMRRVVEDIAASAARLGVTPREAALRLAADADIDHDAPPYGTSRYTR
jgi:glutamate dehydrogenase (NAD(P)+)